MVTTTIYPDKCPMSGITFASNGRVDVADSSLLIGVGQRVMEIVTIDCFPGSPMNPQARSVLSVEMVFSSAERIKLEKAIESAETLLVTIPEPHAVSHQWMTDLQNAAPKPGHVWINSAETISDVLTGGLDSMRREIPSYPTDCYRSNGPQSSRPAARPDPGLTTQIIPQQIIVDGSADNWRVTTRSGHELVVSLLDCYVGDKSYGDVCEVLASASGSVMAITLPPPIASTDWIGTLKPGTLHAGYIWLDSKTTLNQVLVDRGIGSRSPV